MLTLSLYHLCFRTCIVQPGKPGVRVAGTVEGGSAAASGAISEGMQLMSVYGEDCRNLTFDEVITLVTAALLLAV
jgi:PDZ domain